ncbi:hypothetical protein AAFF_G00120560 [Aldrovandia affinis]|uniref:5'-nucleotidase n=1 Tax=Aldrovandia affinis TaxID=143900 RepID=A0AAD7RS22_9TELE|nr:hypothetical protein AAFF_G00120560 [Aldrovandia affinis]
MGPRRCSSELLQLQRPHALVVVSSLLLLLLSCVARRHVSAAAAAGPMELALLHTNDVHARIEETCSSKGLCFAGVARRFAKIRDVRSREANVLLLDAGDQFQGTVWFTYYKGAEAAYFMNKLGYDAMALGNHEFDNGVEGLIKPFLQEVNCSVLSANIRPDQTLAPKISGYYKPYKIFDINSEKVAVVGYTSTETPVLSIPGPHLVFEDEVKALQLQVDKLVTLGVNKIIALGHSGFAVDKEIAKRVRGVDVVIGGHSNTFLYTGRGPLHCALPLGRLTEQGWHTVVLTPSGHPGPHHPNEVPEGSYPFKVRSEDGRDVPVVQAYAFGKYLGYLKVTFDEAGLVVRAAGNPVLLDGSVPQDPGVLADVESWKRNLSHYSLQYVGETLVYLNGTSEECRFRECNLGNLICDAMVHHNVKSTDEAQWSHVSACVMNGGSIRSPIDERSRNGSITMEDLIGALPFACTYDLVQLKGSTLKKIFEHSVKRYGGGTGEFLQVSGIQVELDVSRPPWDRVTGLRLLCTHCRVPSYQPLNLTATYRLVVPSYLVDGGDGYSMIRDEMLKHNSGDLDISVVADYISDMKRVYPAVEGRIKFASSRSIPVGAGHVTSPLPLLWLLGLASALSTGL